MCFSPPGIFQIIGLPSRCLNGSLTLSTGSIRQPLPQHGPPFLLRELENIRQSIRRLSEWTLLAVSEQLEQRDAEAGDGWDIHSSAF